MSKDSLLQELQPLTVMNREELENAIYNSDLKDRVITDSELAWCFTALGLGGVNSETKSFELFGKAEKGGSQNFLWRNTPVQDRKADAEKFITMQFTIELYIKNRLYICDKIGGDDYALILDSYEKPLGAIRFVQDTRSPWVLIPGDDRPFGIHATDKDQPDAVTGCCHQYRWWVDNCFKNSDGTTTTKKSRFGIMARDLNAFVDKINETYFGIQSLNYVAPKSLSRAEKRNFIGASTISGTTMNGPDLEIVKNTMDSQGEIYINGVLIGHVTVQDPPKNARNHYDGFQLRITTDKDAISELGVTHQQVMDGVNKMLTVETTPREQPRGKNSFRNTALADKLR